GPARPTTTPTTPPSGAAPDHWRATGAPHGGAPRRKHEPRLSGVGRGWTGRAAALASSTAARPVAPPSAHSAQAPRTAPRRTASAREAKGPAAPPPRSGTAPAAPARSPPTTPSPTEQARKSPHRPSNRPSLPAADHA